MKPLLTKTDKVKFRPIQKKKIIQNLFKFLSIESQK